MHSSPRTTQKEQVEIATLALHYEYEYYEYHRIHSAGLRKERAFCIPLARRGGRLEALVKLSVHRVVHAGAERPAAAAAQQVSDLGADTA